MDFEGPIILRHSLGASLDPVDSMKLNFLGP